MKLTRVLLPLSAFALLLLVCVCSPWQSPSSYAAPIPTPTPPDICPSGGSPFETPINAVPIPHPAAHSIDALCPRGGTDDHNAAHRLQNAIKNNFTAAGNPITLGFNGFTFLQKRVDQLIQSGQIHLTNDGYPVNRETTLKNLMVVDGTGIGEGSVVTLQGFVYGSHYSNTKFNVYSHNERGRGESNNCKCNRLDWNDIHIALSDTTSPLTDECKSVTAEISPHYRSEAWTHFHDGQNTEIEAQISGFLRGRVVSGLSGNAQPLAVRITGPLFYDASHQPCRFNSAGSVTHRESPARRTVWEIHPVYRIQYWDAAHSGWRDFG